MIPNALTNINKLNLNVPKPKNLSVADLKKQNKIKHLYGL